MTAGTGGNKDAERKASGCQAEGVAATLLFWQPRVSKSLNAEDARQMIENVTGFFAQLAAWEADLRTAEAAVPLKNSKVTEISAIAHEATSGPEFKQEYADCKLANDSWAA
jgi:hypothetical protein